MERDTCDTLDDAIAFLHSWYRYVEGPHEDPAVTLPAGLPESLAKLYREFGGLLERREGGSRGPFSGQDHLCAPSRLELEGGVVTFAVENQGNWSCRVALGEPDPPVQSDARSLWDPAACGFEPVCSSLSHFLVTLGLQEAVMSAKFLVSVDDRWQPAGQWAPLWTRGGYVQGEASHAFFDCAPDRALAMVSDGIWLASNASDPRELLPAGTDSSKIFWP